MPTFEELPPIHRLKSIPANFVTSGNLDLRGATALFEIGPNMRVGGSLWLGGVARVEGRLTSATDKQPKHFSQCQLEALPEGLSIGGAACLQSCVRITRLPASIRVEGALELRGLPRLVELPAGVARGSELRLIGLPRLTALPAGLPKLKQLLLDGVGLQTLPDDLQMAEASELIIQRCANLETLPAHLLSSGLPARIIIRECPRLRLPPEIAAAELISLRRLRALESSPRLRAPMVRIGRCSALASVLESIETKSLIIHHCPKITSISAPSGPLSLLSMAGCVNLESLPPSLHFGGVPYEAELDVTNCTALKSLPPDLRADGVSHDRDALIVKSDGSGLQQVPAYSFSWKVAVRGVRLEPEFALRPESADPSRILLHRNAEVRRILIDRLGIANLLNRMEHAVIDEDTYAGGLRRLLGFRLGSEISRIRRSRPAAANRFPFYQTPAQSLGYSIGRFIGWLMRRRIPAPRPNVAPPAVEVASAARTTSPRDFNTRFLQCRCPTTQREYLLPVPEHVITCRQAAAWMAGFDNPADYTPVQET